MQRPNICASYRVGHISVYIMNVWPLGPHFAIHVYSRHAYPCLEKQRATNISWCCPPVTQGSRHGTQIWWEGKLLCICMRALCMNMCFVMLPKYMCTHVWVCTCICMCVRMYVICECTCACYRKTFSLKNDPLTLMMHSQRRSNIMYWKD